MRDFSLGAVLPLRALLRILLHLPAFFGLRVCWIPISAHSITELPDPMSLSPFPIDLRTWTLRNSRWNANRDVRLNALIWLVSREPACIRHALPMAVPQYGHRWKDATKILVSTKNAVILVWRNKRNLQKIHA